MFHIHRSKDKQFYFTLNAKNGKVIMTSETYKRKRSIFNAIKKIIANIKWNDVKFNDHTV